MQPLKPKVDLGKYQYWTKYIFVFTRTYLDSSRGSYTCYKDITNGMELKTFYNVYETMYESVRLTTFTNWKSKCLTKEEASQEGWVECRSEGKIKLQCVFCGSFRTLELKNPSMKGSLKKSHNIYCPIFCSHPSGNVPLFTDNLDEAEAYKFLENYLKERKENKHICMGYKPGYGESEQNFAYPYKRQETFKNWPLDFFPESLIEAGFIYTGGLYNWSSDDDPKKKHETHYSTCPFITLKDEIPSENTFRALTDYEKDLLLKHPIGKFMTELLQDSEVKIKETLSSFLTKYGVMPITVGQGHIIHDNE
ncbi:hypothetical protein Avbf_06535 [Armadillidium vulgare]|nr:hypothetical protein Avbf_06535 [Armadillidium vulgare]